MCRWYVGVLSVGDIQREQSPQQQPPPTPSPPPQELRAVVLAVRSLVQAHADRDMTSQCLHAAQESLKSNPEGTLQRIVAHFQRVFDVKYVRGVGSKDWGLLMHDAVPIPSQ